jgi:hypothetical protein
MTEGGTCAAVDTGALLVSRSYSKSNCVATLDGRQMRTHEEVQGKFKARGQGGWHE